MHLAKLPTELWVEVTAFLDFGDLKNLRLANGTLRDLATPSLFKEIKLGIGQYHKDLRKMIEVLAKITEDGCFNYFQYTRTLTIKQSFHSQVNSNLQDFSLQYIPKLIRILPQLRAINIAINLRTGIDVRSLSALFKILSSYSDQYLISMELGALRYGMEYDNCLENISSLDHFYLSGCFCNHPKGVEQVANILVRSPKLRSLCISSHQMTFDNILSKMPENWAFSQLHELSSSIELPSEPPNVKKIASIQKLVVDRSLDLIVTEADDVDPVSMNNNWEVFGNLGLDLSELTVDLVNEELFQYLTRETTMKQLKRFKLLLPSHARGLLQPDEELEDLSRMFWSEVIPPLMCHLEILAVAFNEFVEGTIESDIWAPKDARLWAVNNLEPYIPDIDSCKQLKSIQAMVVADANANEEWLTQGTNIIHGIRSKGASKLLARLCLVHESEDDYRRKRVSNKIKLQQSIFEPALAKSGLSKAIQGLQVEIKSFFVIDD